MPEPDHEQAEDDLSRRSLGKGDLTLGCYRLERRDGTGRVWSAEEGIELL